MKLQLGKKASDLFVIAYLLATLFVRFRLEEQLAGHFVASIGIGAFALLFLWALTKSRFINPTWFGLLSKSN